MSRTSTSPPPASSETRAPVSPSGTVSRRELTRFLDDLLDGQAGKDFGPNGLQVEGTDTIRKVVTGVSACAELFEIARERGADAVLVHHGIFWDWQSPVLTGPHLRRVRLLLGTRGGENGEGAINLYAYHLPLDRDMEVGNNALAARALGLEDLAPFAEHAGLPVGVSGRFPEPIPAAELERRCQEFYEREPLAFLGGPDPLSSVAIVSGGATKEFQRAIDEGFDAYITGEVSEWVMNTARESGTHYLSCGHYATERCGIRAVGERVAERFGVEVEFVDVPNPV